MVSDRSGFAVPAAVTVFVTLASVVPVVVPGSFWPLLLLGVAIGTLGGALAYWGVERSVRSGSPNAETS